MKLFGRKGRLQAEDGGFGAAFDASNNISSSEPQGQERQDQHQHQHQHEQHQQQHQHQQEDEDEDSDNGGGAREERLPTIDLQRSRGFSNADMDADMVSILYQQQQLRVERQLSLPDQHPRSNSQESYGQTDQEDAESEDMGSRSDRHSSIEVRRTDVAHFAVDSTSPEQWSTNPRDGKGYRRLQGFAFGQNLRRL
ncbi:unnamed protein product [Pylaiella littoralis]